MKTKKIIARVSAWLLMLAMLAVLVPATVSAETLDDHLLIHYDFEGDNPLDDKAGSVNSKLQAISGVTYTKEETTITGITPTVIDDTSSLFKVENGVITATATTTHVNNSTDNKFLLAAIGTTDVEATYGHAVNGSRNLNGTYYLRVKVPAAGRVTLLYNRNMNASSRCMNIYAEPNGVISVNSGNGTWSATPAFVINDWMEIAVVRNATDGVEDAYIWTNGAWKPVSHAAYKQPDDVMSIFSLFGHLEASGVQSGWTGNINGMAYDDVRYYDTALTTAELNQVHGEVIYGNTLESDVPATSFGTGLGALNKTYLQDNLLIHYDFEGDTWSDQLSDKAGTNTFLTPVNKGSTNAITGEVSDSDFVVLDETKAKTFFKIENGVATSLQSGATNPANGLLTGAALISGITADTKAIQTAESSVTWFMRVNLPASTQCIPLNFRNTSTGVNERPFSMEYNGVGGSMNLYIPTDATGSATTANVGALYTAGKWMDMAFVRSYNTDTSKYDYTFFYKAVGDFAWTIGAQTSQSAIPTSNASIISLFANAQNQQEAIWALTKDISIDDVRVYNTALTVEQLDIITNAQSNVTMLGAQRSKNTFDNNQSYKVRLVAQINGNAWTDAGFKVTANDGTDLGTQDLKVNVAYTSILAQEDGGLNNVITASSGCYLISIVIEGIPVAKDNLTLTVTPYASDGTTPVEGQAVVITLENAQITSITWAN